MHSFLPDNPVNMDPVTGLYKADCIWSPYPVRQRVRASIMDHQYIVAVRAYIAYMLLSLFLTLQRVYGPN